MKLRFSRYLLVAWLSILELHHCASFLPTSSRSRHTGGVAAAIAGAAEMRALMKLQNGEWPPVGRLGCLTAKMKRNEPQSVRGPLEEAGGTKTFAALVMRARGSPVPSLPLTCASVTSRVRARSSLHALSSHQIDMYPHRSVVSNALFYAQAVGLIMSHFAKMSVIGLVASCSAAVLAAGALLPFAFVAIHLLRERAS